MAAGDRTDEGARGEDPADDVAAVRDQLQPAECGVHGGDRRGIGNRGAHFGGDPAIGLDGLVDDRRHVAGGRGGVGRWAAECQECGAGLFEAGPDVLPVDAARIGWAWAGIGEAVAAGGACPGLGEGGGGHQTPPQALYGVAGCPLAANAVEPLAAPRRGGTGRVMGLSVIAGCPCPRWHRKGLPGTN